MDIFIGSASLMGSVTVSTLLLRGSGASFVKLFGMGETLDWLSIELVERALSLLVVKRCSEGQVWSS